MIRYATPRQKTCTSCGRNQWKVAVVFDGVAFGQCPSCFAGAAKATLAREAGETGYAAVGAYRPGAFVLIDRRGETAKRRAPVPQSLVRDAQ